ncbi:hypothetical protein LQ327_09035 [Actinomycetospora endophytica]|uniref:Uncharacterized protein n=1 Tax=Actinomycetospora endophytica TaxID=2291215 RepID=A0ABS8P7Y5_9PSEU|nr:hypothetical protein [Actinomycetospora endophytica]MCD2193526.1 hypothetical protein [Actinomycetospora endophytica]
MAGYWPNAALRDQYWPHDLRLNGEALPGDMANKLTTGAVSRSITQASTIQMVFEDGNRALLSHTGADPFQYPAPRYVYGIPTGHSLVQFSKNGDQLTLTAEDAVINLLRNFTGQKNQAPGTRTRVDFAKQLCDEARVPFIADYDAAPLAAPVSRGGTNAPNEDSWTCLTRLAQDVGWRCFSDGTSVLFGPDSWLLSWPGGPAMTIAERTGGVDVIDGEMDSGKPVGTLNVTSRASAWFADPGAWVRVTAGMGPFSGDWIVSEINRQDLASDQLAVALIAPTPVKPEPTASGTSTTNDDPNVSVPIAGTEQRIIIRLQALGYRPGAGGVFSVPQSVLDRVQYGDA